MVFLFLYICVNLTPWSRGPAAKPYNNNSQKDLGAKGSKRERGGGVVRRREDERSYPR